MATTVKFTVSIPARLVEVLDQEQGTTRSEAIARLLEKAERERREAEMAEGYRAMAEENREDSGLFLAAQSEVVLRDPPR